MSTPTETIAEAGALMRDHKTYALFVTEAEGVGIVTRSDLLDAALCDRVPLDSPIGPLAHRPVVSVAPDDLVTTALLRMTKSNKRRVAIGEDGQFVGVLEDIDLLSFLAGNSQLVARADRPLAPVRRPRAGGARESSRKFACCAGKGSRIDLVCEIVSDLNRRLHRKALCARRAEIDPRGGLLLRDGQRGAGRADVPHGPGQRAHSRWARAGGGPRQVPRRRLRRAGANAAFRHARAR